jgi:excisionase family DNA binding protein
MWTTFQVAAYLNLRPSRIYELVHRRQIPVTRIGERQLRFERAAIRQWIDARTTQVQEGER